jgi:hypothetical protein
MKENQVREKTTPDIDEYIAGFPADVQVKLEKLTGYRSHYDRHSILGR